MTHPDIAAAFVRERSRTLMAEAEAVRRARQAATSSKLVPRGRSVPLLRSASVPLMARGLAWLTARPGRARLARPAVRP